MKKVLIILAIVLAALILIGAVALVVFLVSLPSSSADGGSQDLQIYLQTQWPEFPVEEYDAQSGKLVLSYQTGITYEQAQKYGQSAGYDEVAQGHVSTMKTLRSACASACKVSLNQIIIHGYSTDGEVIYTITDSGDLSACWKE